MIQTATDPKAATQISVTERAAQQVQRILKETAQASQDPGLRVGVKGGGCSGLTYILDFAAAPAQGEKVFESNGVKLFVDFKSFLYLRGTQLDYSGGLNGKGFVFSNPNATRTCGCGTSFSV